MLRNYCWDENKYKVITLELIKCQKGRWSPALDKDASALHKSNLIFQNLEIFQTGNLTFS